MSRTSVDPEVDTAPPAAAEVARRVVAHRLNSPDQVDEVVQETMARLVAHRSRLEDSAVLPFVIVTARNLVASRARDEDRDRRHAHRLVELREPDRPDDVLIRDEERSAVRAALDRLSDRDRKALLAHELQGASTRELADAGGTSPGAIAVRMAAARAKLRVEYLLSYRRTEPPTSRCRPVLVALSAGDRRRQRALDAGGHLLDCDTCASLSEPLLQRRRALAAWWPVPLLPPAIKLALRAMKEHPARTTASIAVAAGLAAGGLLLVERTDPDPGVRIAAATATSDATTTATSDATTTTPAARQSAVEAGGQPVLPLEPGESLASFAGQTVEVREAMVLSVDADEGFWIGDGPEQRLWVQLSTPAESGFELRAGQHVSFDGRFVAHPLGFAAMVGVDASEGAALLDLQAHHIEVAAVRLAIDE